MNQREEPPSNATPLREPTFFILLSLAEGEKHGYAILKDVEALSRGKIMLSTGTLYEALARLLDQDLIQRAGAGTEMGDNSTKKTHPGRPRKAYRLTPRGRRVLTAETYRMQELAAAAMRRLGLERG